MIKFDNLKGMNNRQRAEALPDGYVRNAVNVDFDNQGNLRLRNGNTQLYSGSGCHSFDLRYFVESGDLKRLESDNTATTVKSTVGDSAMLFTQVGGIIYYGNETTTGRIVNGVSRNNGAQTPIKNPDCLAVVSGGMFAGDYQVTMTWIDDLGEESGALAGKRLTVAEGGGIFVDNFPTPPGNIDKLALYVTSVNGEEFYLYGEYPATTGQVNITKSINSIPLRTQFCYVPEFKNQALQAHYGRIYWADGNLLRFTLPQRYGLTKANHFLPLDSQVAVIASIPNALYVATLNKTYRITNLDGEGFPVRTEIKPYGAVPGSLAYDSNTTNAFWHSDKGFVTATDEGVGELTYAMIAASLFTWGASLVVERDGVKMLVGRFKGGTASNQLDSEYRSNEIARKGNAI